MGETFVTHSRSAENNLAAIWFVIIMVKRDRWDSSSEDEGKPVAKNAISKKKSKDETSKLKQEEKEIMHLVI